MLISHCFREKKKKSPPILEINCPVPHRMQENGDTVKRGAGLSAPHHCRESLWDFWGRGDAQLMSGQE